MPCFECFTATFKDHLVGEEIVADYLLYLLNKNQEFGYVSALGLETPTDNIHELMIHIAVQRNLRLKIRDSQGISISKTCDF